jgi:hypothetical protein
MIRPAVSARSGRATAYSETGSYRRQRYRYHQITGTRGQSRSGLLVGVHGLFSPGIGKRWATREELFPRCHFGAVSECPTIRRERVM